MSSPARPPGYTHGWLAGQRAASRCCNVDADGVLAGAPSRRPGSNGSAHRAADSATVDVSRRSASRELPIAPTDDRTAVAGLRVVMPESSSEAVAAQQPRPYQYWPLYAAGFVTAFGAHSIAANLGGYGREQHATLLTVGLLLAV